MVFTFILSDKAVAEDPALLRYAEVLQMMATRMSVSHFKYDDMDTSYPDNAKAIDNADERRKLYRETGNVEHLLDDANFAVIEFLFPSHANAHHECGDETVKSPGLVYRYEDAKGDVV